VFGAACAFPISTLREVWILSFIPFESQQLFCAGKRAGGFIEKHLAIF
jgi:hypothetical protein